MTYNVQIEFVNYDGERKCVFIASRITEEHLEAIFEHVVPNYNPLGHEITVTANITKEEAENERNRIY